MRRRGWTLLVWLGIGALLCLGCPEDDDDATDDDAGDDDTADDDTGDDDTGDDDGGDDDGGDDDTGDDDGGDDDTGDDDTADDDGGDDDTGPPPGTWPTRVFAPYVDATAYPTPELGDIADTTSLAWFTLGFIVDETGTACTPSWGTYYDLATGPSSWGPSGKYYLYDEIAHVRTAHGGDVMVSFGGAANTPLAAACTDVSSLVTAYTDTIDALNLIRIDFDVEGYWVADHAPGGSVERRSQAIAQLQTNFANAGRPLEVWYTLPVLPSGLTPDGIAVLDSGLTHGVEIDGVNVMTMDYGDGAAPNPQDMMGEYGIQAIQSLHAQLDTLYTTHGIPKTSAELWAMIGTTPMIGMNDVVTELFHLQDAQETLDFANQEQIGMISMWSLNRDHPCPKATWVQLDCSSIPDQTKDWQFTAIFNPYTTP